MVLRFVLVGCAPQVETEDPNAPYKQSLLPAFQADIASLGEIPRYSIAVSLGTNALTLTGAISRCDALGSTSHLIYRTLTDDLDRTLPVIALIGLAMKSPHQVPLL